MTMSVSIHARDNREVRPDGLPTEGAVNELVPAQEALDQRSALDKLADQEAEVDINEIRDEISNLKREALENSLPWYLGEYFYWTQSSKGTFYLSPIDSVMNDLISRVSERQAKAADLFSDELAGYIPDLADAFKTQDETDRALFSNADDEYGPVTKRHQNLMKEAIEQFYFAACTRYELESWQRRLSAKGQERPQNFIDKSDRGEKAAKRGQLLYMVARVVAPDVASEFTTMVPKVVRDRLYTKARIEGNKLTNPGSFEANDKAEKQVDAEMLDLF
jgi:hypothetical protein